ncbi:MAG: DUF21 domain-containing protein [Planctomycetota bacterium]|nr:MAG: DUF21 domain-containing protein [Planctomycetota bacterium]
MIFAVAALGLLGLALSALFSGAETGLYRVARLRLEVTARTGDWVVGALTWLADRPSLFVATVLVGNNIANYLVSLAIVLSIQVATGAPNHVTELVVTLLASPVVFLLCELLPKRLFLRAPFRLLRAAGIPLLVGSVVLAPVSVLLWLVNRALAIVVGGQPEGVREALRRRELTYALDEGREAGLLYQTQYRVARNLFLYADRLVTEYVKPFSAVPCLPSLDMSPQEAARIAVEQHARFLIVKEPDARTAAGYVDAAKLTSDVSLREILEPLPRLFAEQDFLESLIHMYDRGRPIAQVIDARGVALGIIALSDLRDMLLDGVHAA